MAKGYKENEQAFGEGDICRLTDDDGKQWVVRVSEVWQTETGNYGYTVFPVEFNTIFPREVPQYMLEYV